VAGIAVMSVYARQFDMSLRLDTLVIKFLDLETELMEYIENSSSRK